MERQLKVLVAGRESPHRTVLVELLRPRVLQVRESGTAQDTFECLSREPAGLVFYESPHPDLGDREFLAAALQQSPDTYFVAVIELPTDALISRAITCGATDFLRASPTPAEVEEIVMRWSAAASRRTRGANAGADVESASVELKLPSAESSVLLAREASIRILKDRLPPDQLRQFELVIDEALRNAYEHGNLGITSKEKIALCESGGFEAELRKRSKIAQAQGKRILFRVHVDKAELTCTVTDEGAGFDWKNLTEYAATPELLAQPSGRGLYLMRKFFDHLEYNTQGNSLKLVKKLQS